MVDGDGTGIIVTVVVIAQSRAWKRQESWWAFWVARVPASSAKLSGFSCRTCSGPGGKGPLQDNLNDFEKAKEILTKMRYFSNIEEKIKLKMIPL
ncbi:Iron-sulfur cluster co-chaperone protein HscB, mitochondrial [Myotis brandtii]|uniref:Iron-sulfur cluster co-chaperone protein HscB, mitochondrial n=1 Tax=Myotis brandtii TaxID=109478 RepID=S7N1N8_MYOBR|nr:Iron-sulfur cluster co-chaperone protein HscB, mitochondrial [Myotis brandtii]